MLRHSGSETDNILLVLKDELKEHLVPSSKETCCLYLDSGRVSFQKHIFSDG